jgi:hypothetical protein
MTSLVVACPLCSAPLAIPREIAGQAITCPVCSNPIRLPALPDEPAPAAIPAVVAKAPVQHGRRSTRPAGLPLAVLGMWAAILGLVAVAVVMLWRERAAQIAQMHATHQAPPVRAPQVGKRSAQKPTVTTKTPVEATPSQASVPKTPSKPPPTAAPREPGVSPKKQSTPNAAPPPATALAPPSQPPSNVWELPPLAAFSPYVLESFPQDSPATIELSLTSSAADLPAGSAIEIQPQAESGSWTVAYAPDSAPTAGRVALATLSHEGRDLQFTWLQPFANAELRRQLANCQLMLCQGEITRLIQLRARNVQNRLLLDLSDDRQTVEFALPDLPKLANLRLQVHSLSGFPGGTSIRGGIKSLAIGKSAVIEFAETPGAEIELRFFKPSGSDNVVLRAEPVFMENRARESELSLKNLDEAQKRIKKARDRDTENLQKAQTNRDAARRTVDQLRAKPPMNAVERQIYGPAMRAALDRLEDQEGRLRTLTAQIARADARLQAVPKLRSFIQSIHNRAAISYRLVAECGERDLVLVDATEPPPR